VSHVTCSYNYVYAYKCGCNVKLQLRLQHDLYDIIFKIKRELRKKIRSALPPTPSKKFWVRTCSIFCLH